MVEFSAPLGLGKRVHIDGCTSVVAIIVAACFRSDMVTYELEWMDSGAMQSCWVAAWRLKAVGENKVAEFVVP